MPATSTGKAASGFVLGVDGCRIGWVVMRLDLASGALTGSVVNTFRDIIDGDDKHAKAIMVDMPIGLADAERRACETKARALLKPLRSSSVFPSPKRPMLDFEDYADANAWGKAQGEGMGLSKQAWMITPKIREIDDAIDPSHQSRIGEAHPEVAFYRLNQGQPCRHPKRKPEGAKERYRLLAKHGLKRVGSIVEQLITSHGAGVALDDVYDACVLTLTAKARLEGTALHLTDGARDTRGLLMEIWG